MNLHCSKYSVNNILIVNISDNDSYCICFDDELSIEALESIALECGYDYHTIDLKEIFK